MPDRNQITLIIAAAYSAVISALLSFLITGLTIDRFPRDQQQALTKLLVAVPCVVLVAGLALAYRLTRDWSSVQTRPGKWLMHGFAASAAGFMAGVVLFSLALKWLPRRWFSRGGDWDFDPLIETVAFGLTPALIGFWWVYGRSRRPQQIR